MEIVRETIIKIIPLLITLYFYGLPKVLISKSVKDSIKTIISNIEGVDNKTDAMKSINGITGLMSFLGFFGSTTGYIISLKSSNTFIIIISIFLFCSLYFPFQYIQKSLILEKNYKIYELVLVTMITIFLVINNFIR